MNFTHAAMHFGHLESLRNFRTRFNDFQKMPMLWAWAWSFQCSRFVTIPKTMQMKLIFCVYNGFILVPNTAVDGKSFNGP